MGERHEVTVVTPGGIHLRAYAEDSVAEGTPVMLEFAFDDVRILRDD